VLSITPALANPPKAPTIAQIEAAKKAEAEKKKAADAAAARLNKANLTLRQLTAVANAARAKYEAAKRELAVAVKEAKAATAAYNVAVSEVKAAHDAIGRLAANAYIMGGGFTDLDSILHSDGPQDLMDRLSTLDTLGDKNTQALFRFKAAEVVAKDAKKAADVAKLAQEVATKKVEATKIEADAARNAQQKEVDKLQNLLYLKKRMPASRITLRFTQESGQILVSKVAQHHVQLPKCALRLLSLQRNKYWHVSLISGAMKVQMHLIALAWFMRRIALRDLVGQTGIALTPRCISVTRNMSR
jgi:hypothetical protein